jgi:hypothetical protein
MLLAIETASTSYELATAKYIKILAQPVSAMAGGGWGS